MNRFKKRDSFTLVELLVVLAIVAILSTVVVMTLNPAELLRQERDSTRLSDAATIDTALNIFNADTITGFMGTSSVLYISVPDTSRTCANLGLPALPTGWTYNCVTSTSTKNVDGTGWIPVNFKQISSGSPLGSLPVDPTNSTSSNYYSYITGGSWQLAAKLESQKYITQSAANNDYDPGTYIVGSNVNLAPFVGGMVAWWTFEDGNETTSTDSSGWARNGTWNGTSTSHYGAGRVGAYSAYFNGSSDWVNYLNSPTLNSNYDISYSFWNLPTGSSNNTVVCTSQRQVKSETTGIDYSAVGIIQTTYSRTNSGAWEHVVVTSTGTAQAAGAAMNMYVNGVLVKTFALGRGNAGGGPYIGSLYGTQQYFSGYVDDLRIYKRVLTAAEVLAIYNATK